MKRISWQMISVVVVMIVAVVYTLPSINPALWPHKKINLGLDLQGGMHLALEVETQKTVEGTIDRSVQELKEDLRKKHIHYAGIERTDKTKLKVQIEGQGQIDAYQKILDQNFRDLRVVSQTMDGEKLTMLLDLPPKEAERIQRLAVDQALETIRNRIDQFGVSEPDIRLQGTNQIQIQLPGVKDTQRAKELIGRTALLEFKLLDETHNVDEAVAGNIPPGDELLYEYKTDPDTLRTVKTPYLVQKRTLLTGAYLTDAKVQIDSQYNEPYVSIQFDQKGAALFERITGANVKKRLAIVLDNKIYSAPVIQEKIAGGSARITGNFNAEQAHDLAIVLRAGALPAPVKVIEERTVGPSLGTDSIHQGLFSMLVGGLLVVFFMIVFYKASGVVADIALAVNILLIAAGLAGFQATLTLPGIAGIILTIGMAVDANVLIFERIREELLLGKTPRAAIDAGYDRATLTILDANVTTLIAALVMFQFGTGPVKGFAVTLSLGVVSSVFTALVLTKVVFDYFLMNRKIKTLSI